MHFVYLDETGDEQSNGFCALAVPVANYPHVLNGLKSYRRKLRTSDGIYTTTEFHAAKFTSGRGRLGLRGKGITQQRRCEIFEETLSFVAAIPDVHLLSAFKQGGKESKIPLLERLLNRVHKAVQSWGSNAILIFDEGDARNITRMTRKLSVFNPIKSKYGTWPDGKEFKNFPLNGFLEDPVFRVSRNSYFIQVVDFCAYALFQKECASPSRARFGLHKSFENYLPPICVKEASSDPFGIVR